MIPEQWNGLVLRLISEAKRILARNKDGVAIITLHVMVDAEGIPTLWVVADGKRLEPSGNVKEALIKALT